MNIYIQQKYCVYITHYSGDKVPPNYIGSSTIKKIQKGYKGSVKSKKYKNIWENELKNNYNLFDTYIISTHYTRQEALYKELKLQKILNVVKNPLFANQSYAIPNGYFGMDVSGKNNPNYNKKWNKKRKKKSSDIMKSKEMQEKIKKLNIIKRGVNHHTKTIENENKKKNTVLNKYGVENISQSPKIKAKKIKKLKKTRELTKIKRFGYENKKKFISDIMKIITEKNLYNDAGKLKISELIKYFNSYGNGGYNALYRFCENNNILYNPFIIVSI